LTFRWSISRVRIRHQHSSPGISRRKPEVGIFGIVAGQRARATTLMVNVSVSVAPTESVTWTVNE